MRLLTTPRSALVLSAAALLATAYVPAASANLMWGCLGGQPQFPEVVCENHPCRTTVPSFCRWTTDYGNCVTAGGPAGLVDRVTACGLP